MAGVTLPTRTDKPWGGEALWALTRAYAAKLIHVRGGHRLSLQLHERKDESMYVLSGVLTLELDGVTHVLRAGQSVHVPAGCVHRLSVSTPQLDDVIRLEDDYGRM
jgi:mannose-6-phosphate isomerase